MKIVFFILLLQVKLTQEVCPQLGINSPINILNEYFDFIYDTLNPLNNDKSIRLVTYNKNENSESEKFIFEILFLTKNKGKKRFIGIEANYKKKSNTYGIDNFIQSKYFDSVKRLMGLYDINDENSVNCIDLKKQFWKYFNDNYASKLSQMNLKINSNQLVSLNQNIYNENNSEFPKSVSKVEDFEDDDFDNENSSISLTEVNESQSNSNSLNQNENIDLKTNKITINKLKTFNDNNNSPDNNFIINNNNYKNISNPVLTLNNEDSLKNKSTSQSLKQDNNTDNKILEKVKNEKSEESDKSKKYDLDKFNLDLDLSFLKNNTKQKENIVINSKPEITDNKQSIFITQGEINNDKPNDVIQTNDYGIIYSNANNNVILDNNYIQNISSNKKQDSKSILYYMKKDEKNDKNHNENNVGGFINKKNTENDNLDNKKNKENNMNIRENQGLGVAIVNNEYKDLNVDNQKNKVSNNQHGVFADKNNIKASNSSGNNQLSMNLVSQGEIGNSGNALKVSNRVEPENSNTKLLGNKVFRSNIEGINLNSSTNVRNGPFKADYDLNSQTTNISKGQIGDLIKYSNQSKDNNESSSQLNENKLRGGRRELENNIRLENMLKKILEFEKKSTSKNEKSENMGSQQSGKENYLVRKTEFYDVLGKGRLEALKKILIEKGSLSNDEMIEMESLIKEIGDYGSGNDPKFFNKTRTNKLYKSGYYSGLIH